MALSYDLGYQESISVHPTRRQIFAGKPYSTFPNMWQWLIYWKNQWWLNQPTDRQGEYKAIGLFQKLENRKRQKFAIEEEKKQPVFGQQIDNQVNIGYTKSAGSPNDRDTFIRWTLSNCQVPVLASPPPILSQNSEALGRDKDDTLQNKLSHEISMYDLNLHSR